MSQITKFYLALDIEKAGDRFCDPILMIGCCLGDATGRIIETRAFCGPVPDEETFDQRCWTEFWMKNLNILQRIRDTAKNEGVTTIEQMMDNFMNYYYDLDQRFGPFTRAGNRRLILLSDNPAFDISSIDQALITYRGQKYTFPLRYTKSGEYNRVSDPSEMSSSLTNKKAKEILEKVKLMTPHDHWAENDAIGIYQWFIEIVKAKTS